MPSCNCQFFNGSADTITSAVLLHTSSAPVVGGEVPFPLGTINNLPSNQVSQTLIAPQVRFSWDYWLGAVTFANDDNTYIFMNDVVPFCECEVPAGGSVSFVIGGTNGSRTLQINTYNDANWQDGDGSCAEQLLTVQQAVEEAGEWAQFIKDIASLLA